jgi:hypothetical protein
MTKSFKAMTLALALSWPGLLLAQGAEPLRDEQAISVLKEMSTLLAGLEQFTVMGEGSADARLDAGLIVANPIEVTMKVNRPGSLQISRFDGLETQYLYVNEGTLTLYQTANGFYGSAEVPAGIEAAMTFALEDLGIEAPLMDLLHDDVLQHLAGSSDPVMYLTGSSRVAGINCHHIAIRNPEVDIQLWVEEGPRPLPRQMILTSKWDAGAPRFVARLDWDLEPRFTDIEFKFVPPEGATRIEFTTAPAQ